MNLFKKDKQTEDLSMTREVKDASPSEINPSNLDMGVAPDPNFNNPFASNEVNSALPENMNSQLPPIDELAPLGNNNGSNSSENNTSFQSGISSNSTPEQTNPETGLNPIFQTPSENISPNGESSISQQPSMNSVGNSGEKISKDEIQEMVDETVEQVIEERWSKIVEKIERVASWKEKQEAHINLIKEDIVTIKDAFEKLEKRLVSKIGSYDKNIMDVNSEIKALEKVFQKITPTLVNNVNELGRIANKFKEGDETPNAFGDR